jgi:hypothetical protein
MMIRRWFSSLDLSFNVLKIKGHLFKNALLYTFFNKYNQ